MVAIERMRALALALPDAVEAPHFERVSFRVRGKIFATLDLEAGRAMLKLPLDEQARAIATEPAAYAAVPGSWGTHGSTYVTLRIARIATFRAFLEIAWGAAREPAKRRRAR